jgi:hypothetical protein
VPSFERKKELLYDKDSSAFSGSGRFFNVEEKKQARRTAIRSAEGPIFRGKRAGKVTEVIYAHSDNPGSGQNA